MTPTFRAKLHTDQSDKVDCVGHTFTRSWN